MIRHSDKRIAPWTLALLIAALLILALPASGQAQQHPYLQQLLEKAERKQIHEERAWQVLLHYQQTVTGGYRSRIDDPEFFLARTGSTEPSEELRATLSSFFLLPKGDGTHAACRFPARFHWLAERLSLNSGQLPVFTCSERDTALAAVEGRSAVLVFPVGHINSPASMFGHTLIRIDGTSSSNLISYAANYAATAEDTNGFVYAWKGLFGKYKGYYSLLPYYIKVKEYSDLEHRDMWEYRLKLAPDEVGMMLKHLWELQGIHSDYFFLDENCSYNLLFLLEVARPELHLTDRTGLFVLPTHTIRIALENGILEEPRYRPSQGTRMGKMLSLLGKDQQKAAFRLANGASAGKDLQLADFPPQERMTILDLAAEYVQIRFARKELEKDAYSRLYLKLLGERSRLGIAPEGMYDIAEPSRPESGHGTMKVAAGGGVRRGKGFVELEAQPAFHTLLDPDNGYLRGAQIKFFDTAVRYYLTKEQLRLEKLHILDILSLAPRDIFFRPLSWKVLTGFERRLLRNGEDRLIYRLNTGGGYAVSSPFGGIWYAFGELDVQAGDGIRARVTAGPGVSVGGIEQLTEWWKVHLHANGFIYKLGDDRTSLELSAAQNFRLTRNNSLSMKYSWEQVHSGSIEDAVILWNYYF